MNANPKAYDLVQDNTRRPRLDDRSGRSLRNYLIYGTVCCLALVGGVGGWAATSDLAGAVIAPSTVVVEGNLKKVQHPTGGVVGELLVRDNQIVKAGDVLLRLDETVLRANLQIVTKNLDQLYGRRARLEAERDGVTTITFPAELRSRAERDPDVREVITGETNFFVQRRRSREGQKAQLAERAAQLGQEIVGLESQRRAKGQEAELIQLELKGVEDLYSRNLIPIIRVMTLRREAARLEGERGALVASVAQSRGKIAEIGIQTLQIDQDLRSEVLRDMREVDQRVGEFTERKTAAEDQLKRVDIRAPFDGIVFQLAVHTVGGVIAPGEQIALVVPQNESLAIEAKVAPQDIEQVRVGQDATIRFTAFNARVTPELKGFVARVSAELTREQQTGVSYYTARLELRPGEIEKLNGGRLIPGMPAEAHVKTLERTALSFIVKPFSDQLARAMKER